MASLMHEGVRAFVYTKTALTSMCVTLLVLYSQAQLLGRIRVEHALYAVAAGYAALVGFELLVLMWA